MIAIFGVSKWNSPKFPQRLGKGTFTVCQLRPSTKESENTDSSENAHKFSILKVWDGNTLKMIDYVNGVWT